MKSPRFILQWAGPKYEFPLTWEQIDLRNQKTVEGKKSIYMFKAILTESELTIGFVEIAIRDFVSKAANVESVLVFREFRGRGYGRQLMSAVVQFGFQELQMNELTLTVFDFNVSAIKCYKSIGFEQFEVSATPRLFENERWDFVRMKLTREQWLKC